MSRTRRESVGPPRPVAPVHALGIQIVHPPPLGGTYGSCRPVGIAPRPPRGYPGRSEGKDQRGFGEIPRRTKCEDKLGKGNLPSDVDAIHLWGSSLSRTSPQATR